MGKTHAPARFVAFVGQKALFLADVWMALLAMAAA
jgi:hypothetical protein